MDIQITKEADALICLMYKKYCEDRKNNISKVKAKQFGSSKIIHETILPKWSFEDVDETCRELSRAGLVNNSYADNIVYSCYLSDLGIIYMENRFKNNLKELIEYISKLTPFFPI